MNDQIWTDKDLLKSSIFSLLVGIFIGIVVGYEIAFEPVKTVFRPLIG